MDVDSSWFFVRFWKIILYQVKLVTLCLFTTNYCTRSQAHVKSSMLLNRNYWHHVTSLNSCSKHNPYLCSEISSKNKKKFHIIIRFGEQGDAVSFLPCSRRFFSGYYGFALSQINIKPTLSNSDSTWNAQTQVQRVNFLITPKCFVGKQITI